jgi:hypothetical protein
MSLDRRVDSLEKVTEGKPHGFGNLDHAKDSFELVTNLSLQFKRIDRSVNELRHREPE